MKDFIDIIKANSRREPEGFAVLDGDRKINYSDFINLINSISNNLISFHSTPKVAFDLNQSIESYALIIAILNIGGTYCPLNIQSPIDRKKQILDEFQPDILVVEIEGNTQIFGIQNVLPITSLLKDNVNKIKIEYNQESTIYVIYTSGVLAP